MLIFYSHSQNIKKFQVFYLHTFDECFIFDRQIGVSIERIEENGDYLPVQSDNIEDLDELLCFTQHLNGYENKYTFTQLLKFLNNQEDYLYSEDILLKIWEVNMFYLITKTKNEYS